MCCVSLLNVDKGPPRWVFYPHEMNRLVNKTKISTIKKWLPQGFSFQAIFGCAPKKTLKEAQSKHVRFGIISSSYDLHINFIFLSLLHLLRLHISPKLNSYGYIYFFYPLISSPFLPSFFRINLFSLVSSYLCDTSFYLLFLLLSRTSFELIYPRTENVNAHAKKVEQKV